MYHFVSGYTAKVAGTEEGVSEPEATFSACFGAAFLVWHPTRYAEMLAEKLTTHEAQAWLVNTGWQGGGPGLGGRIPLAYTRAMIDAIHSGALRHATTVEDPVFGLHVPTQVPGVPNHVLQPRLAWKDAIAYDQAAERLALLYQRNFRQYADAASEQTKAAGPRIAAIK
jgi:phosphoenolpyruvate carboxykinase (ATP)